MSGPIVSRTVEAICRDIKNTPQKGRPAKTVFFGGGTPTTLNRDEFKKILAEINQSHPLTPNCEITSEANPGTTDAEKFQGMRSVGFNRISIGAQSFHPGDLLRLGRVHDPYQIVRAVHLAKEAGFNSVNLDLMFGLPGQSLSSWGKQLDIALSLKTNHLSLYGLTIEPNTRFFRLQNRGMLNLPDDDCQVKMYELALEKAQHAGLAQYEISNFAKPGFECQHNLAYWNAEEYLGFGPGAVGCYRDSEARVRQVKTKHPVRYCEEIESGALGICQEELVDCSTLRIEKIMLGIRLNQGLDPTGLSLKKDELCELAKRGWIEPTFDKIRLTQHGRHFCQEVALKLI